MVLKYLKYNILVVFYFLLVLNFLMFTGVKEVDAVASHVVISEVQIAGSIADDEFIEIYNPTESEVDLSNWSIQRSTIGGSLAKKNFIEGNTIAPYGYFLIANNDYDGVVVADMYHNSFTLSSTGATVFLVSDQSLLSTGLEESIIDKVAIGEQSQYPEGGVYPTVPQPDGSIERKPGLLDELAGNGEDTDNNSFDFVSRDVSEPQNSFSGLEFPGVEPSLTPTPTPTPKNTISPPPSPEPTPRVFSRRIHLRYRSDVYEYRFNLIRKFVDYSRSRVSIGDR